ncbi:sortase [candidate division WWE3 bacterium]|nr:sortase [candidate division WWE3 bacterium]
MSARIMKKGKPQRIKSRPLISGESRKEKILAKISNTLLILGIIFILISVAPFVGQEALFYWKELKNQRFTLASKDSSVADPSATVSDSPFARLISTKPIALEPVDKNFGLVIERIGVNVPVVKDVSVTNQEAYNEALSKGVAHALVSDYPSREPGNVYIFAHASLNFWKLGKYATVFNLLRHLRVGDTIHVFYEGDNYVYKVINNEKYKGFDTYPITRPVLEPLLTLQTCDPPGTTLNRLVVTAKLVEVR